MKVGLDASIPKFPRRFRRRVFVYILIITVLSSSAAFGVFYFRNRQFIQQDVSARGRGLARQLAGQCDLGIISAEGSFLKGPVERVLDEGDVLYVTVHDASGKELRRGTKTQSPAPATFTVPGKPGIKTPSHRPVEIKRSGHRAFVAAVVAPSADGVAFAFGSNKPQSARIVGWVRVGLSERPAQKRLNILMKESLYLSGGLLLFGLLAAAVVTWRVAGPIVRLTRGADQIRQGNLDQRVEITTHDELGQLADSFNRMAWNLKDNMEKLESLNRNLEAEVNRQTRGIRRMSDFVKILNAPFELNRLLTASLNGFLDLADCVAGAVYLHQKDESELVLNAQQGAGKDGFGTDRVSVGKRNVGKAALSEKPLVIADVPENARLCAAVGKPLRAIAYLPVRFGESLEGVLVAASETTVDSSRLDLMVQAAGQMAIAISNARAFTAAERMARELESRNIDLVEQRDLLERQKQQLVEMNRLKSEFLANMTHELRTPLNIITGYSGLMMEGAYGSVNEEQKEALAGIDEGARNLLGLINQTLDYAKIEAGQMTVVVSDLELGQLTKDVVSSAQGLTAERPYSIGVEVADRPIPLSSDEGKIRQILLNLLSNAVKFTEKGHVVVAVDPAKAGGAEIQVRDTGVGIAAKDREVIFEAFRQLDGSSTRAAGGTGLGLAISRSFAEMLGGQLSVESEPGKGSIFTLSLPVRPSVSDTSVSEASAAAVSDLSAAMGDPTIGGGNAQATERSHAIAKQHVGQQTAEEQHSSGRQHAAKATASDRDESKWPGMRELDFDDK